MLLSSPLLPPVMTTLSCVPAGASAIPAARHLLRRCTRHSRGIWRLTSRCWVLAAVGICICALLIKICADLLVLHKRSEGPPRKLCLDDCTLFFAAGIHDPLSQSNITFFELAVAWDRNA